MCTFITSRIINNVLHVKLLFISFFYIINKAKVNNHSKFYAIPSPGYHPRVDTKPRQQGDGSSFYL
jgi:hypothetical protein